MKKITHYYTCVLCSKIHEAPGDPGNLSRPSSGWTKIDLRVKPYGYPGLSMFVCDECMEKDSPEKASLLSSKPSVKPGYVDHKIIQVIRCDGQDCSQQDEKTIGPPNRIPIGAPIFPWATVVGGITRPGERHYCPSCAEVFEPRQKPLAHGGPFESNPFRHVAVEGGLDIGGIGQIQ